ncbi:uncharacterized protein V6R79_003267 [Siganus canaliculatus]
MMCLLLLFMCCCSSVLTVSSCITVDGYLCVSTYWDTVSCDLSITDSSEQQQTYSLKFTEEYMDSVSCPLVAVNGSYSCVCKLVADTFISYNNYNIQLCHESGCLPVAENFFPSLNIQLTPPKAPEVHQTADAFNITWESGYEQHDNFYTSLTFELLLQTSGKENKTLTANSCQSESLLRSSFQPGDRNCINVRSMTRKTEYESTWSQWSPSTCWEIANNKSGAAEQDNIFVILTKSLVPVCAAVGLLLLLFYIPAARTKFKSLSHIPSPAPFFKPLYHKHDGNLQEWLSPQGNFMFMHKSEENVVTDAVIAAPKPATKDPEETRGQNNAQIAQLAFTQCQSSYVGLPGIQEVCPPMTMVCPGGTSYTQLPCSIWGIPTREEVVCPPPKDVLNISRTDSGCSCEDLSQSPECSLPTSPVDSSPPRPCISSDYCILNKTADGFAPVLVSKGCNTDILSDSLETA